MTCVAIDETCERCVRRFSDRDCPDRCSELCNMMARLRGTPEVHEALHAAELCRSCGAPKRDDVGESTEVLRLCRHGRCRNWHCAQCDAWSWGDGPVACPCNSSWWTRLWLRLFWRAAS